MSKLGFIHYNWPGFTFDDFLRFAADCGAGYVELQMSDLIDENPADRPSIGPEALENARAVRQKVGSYGLRVSALAARNDFLQPTAEGVDFQVERMARVARLATILCDEPILRSEGGWPKDDVAPSRWSDALYECFSRCADFVDAVGVTIAIDNHGIVTNDGDLLLGLLKRLDNPRIGSNLDTMNFRWAGNDIATCNRFYTELAPYVKHTHLKDGFGSMKEYRGQALGEGEVDLQHALKALKEANYNGVYLAEYEGKETEGGTGYRKCFDWMKAHVQ